MNKLLLIIILTTFGAIKADLINGPYSPESQELVKIIQDKSLPIPEKFKAQENQIRQMRSTLSQPLDEETLLPSMIKLFLTISKDASFKNLLKNNLTYREALIQFINKDESAYPIPRIANLAQILDDAPGFTNAVRMASQENKISLLFSNASHLFRPNIQNINSKKEWVRIIADNLPKKIVYTNLLDVIKAAMTGGLHQVDPKNAQGAIDFFLSLGMPINLIDDGRKNTSLDLLNILLTKDDYKNDPDLNNLKEFLISKGAKTYAELTPAERGEK